MKARHVLHDFFLGQKSQILGTCGMRYPVTDMKKRCVLMSALCICCTSHVCALLLDEVVFKAFVFLVAPLWSP